MRADYLAYAIIDTVVDNIFPAWSSWRRNRRKFWKAYFQDVTQTSTLELIHRLRRESAMSAGRSGLQDVLNAICRDPLPLLGSHIRPFSATVLTTPCKYWKTWTAQTAAALMEVHLSTSNRMNEVMKY